MSELESFRKKATTHQINQLMQGKLNYDQFKDKISSENDELKRKYTEVGKDSFVGFQVTCRKHITRRKMKNSKTMSRTLRKQRNQTSSWIS